MWFGKNIKCKILLALSMAIPAFAADVAPLSFTGASDATTQQKYWDKLMSFKMWGTNGITMGHASTPDISGAIGTAKGPLKLENGDHNLGGPVYIGGSIEFGDGPDQFLSGPVRVTQNMYVGQNDNTFFGTYCIEGAISKANGKDLQPDFDRGNGRYFQGSAAQSTDASSPCHPDSVSPVPTYLSIPDVPALPDGAQLIPVEDGAVHVGDRSYFHVPPVVDGKKMHDFYINGDITFANNGKLYILMQSSSSLVRYFLNGTIHVTSGSQIQIVYVNKDAVFVDGVWTKLKPEEFTYVDNKDYAGNVLFHCKGDVDWPSMNAEAFFQGSFMSLKTMTLNSNLVLAGQLLAENLVVGHDFDGKSFRYVPFDPPVLKLEPEVGTQLVFQENSQFVRVPIKLEFPAKVDVFFDYCFDVRDNVEGMAGIEDIGEATEEDNWNASRPICSKGETAKVAILEGHDAPDASNPNVSIWLKALLDGIQEGDEGLDLVISNLSGAVMPGDKREGKFRLTIVDADKEPKTKSASVRAAEDIVYTFEKETFHYESVFEKAEKGLLVETLPSKGYLLYMGDTITTKDFFVPVESLADGQLQFVNEENKYGVDPAYTSFKFRVVDEDSVLSKTAETITVYVDPVNDAPVVNDTVFEVLENSSEMDASLIVYDVDDTRFTIAFDKTDPNYALVNSMFSIDPQYGIITIKEGAVLNFEAEVNEFVITVNVTDAASTTKGEGKKTVSSVITIKVLDDNEKPVIRDTTLYVNENVTSGTVVGKVTATDEDKWTVLTYTLADVSGDDPVAALFAIDENGVITVAEGAVLDYENRNEYVIRAIVTDNGEEHGFTNLSDDALVTIKIKDVNEEPEFKELKDEYNVVENTPQGTIFATVLVFDPDASDYKQLKVSLTDNAKKENVTSAEDLFDVVVVPHSVTDSALKGFSLVKILVKDEAALDYEALYEDHFDNTAKQVLFDISLTLTDKAGAELTATTKIRVDDANEEPVVADGAYEIAENSLAGTEVGTVVASDPDTRNPDFGTLYYAIAEKDKDVPFVVDENGVIKVADGAILDYETKNVYTFDVEVTDKVIETPKVAHITVRITDVPEKPEFPNKNPTFAVDENSKKGTKVGDVVASDDDCKDNVCVSLTYVLVADTAAAHAGDYSEFVIDAKTGKITVAKDSTLNYEVKNEYKVRVIVYDGDKDDAGTLTDTAYVTIEINDVNDAPVIENQEFTVVENAKAGTVVDKVVASDEDTWSKLSYKFTDIDPTDKVSKLFTIDSEGIIRVAQDAVLDYETRNEYRVWVVVTDNGSEKGFKDLSDSAIVTIRIKDDDEKPGFDDKNPVFAVDENSKASTEVGVVSASDDDCKDNVCAALTYVLVADTAAAHAGDYGEFVIDAKTGKITVAKDSTLNYEVKNEYKVRVIVYDGDKTAAGTMTDTAFVTINIRDVNDAPVIENQEFTVVENAKAGTVVDTVEASDEDTWSKLSYKLADIDPTDKVANLFTVDSKGVIKVAKDNTLDYETRKEYKIWVIVTDNGKDKGFKNLSDTAVITIRVSDENEPPEFVDDNQKRYEVDENTPVQTLVARYEIKDVDAADADFMKDLVVSLKDKNSTRTVLAESLFSFKLEKDASDGKVYAVIRVAQSPDFEALMKVNKDSVFDVVLTLKDQKGAAGCNVVTLEKKIAVNDVNEAPSVEDGDFTPDENLPKGTVIGELNASDLDTLHVKEYGHLEFAIVGADATFPFAMDSNRIVVNDASKMNYELDVHEYSFDVKVTNCALNASTGKYTENCLDDVAKVTVKIQDVDERPTIIIDDPSDTDDEDDSDSLCIAHCDTTNRGNGDHGKDILTVGVKENVPTGTVVFEYLVYDEDAEDVKNLVPELKVTDPMANVTKVDELFDINLKQDGDRWKIVVTVKDGDKLDYEHLQKNPQYNVAVIVTDPKDPSNPKSVDLKDTILRVIEILDVNESPTFVVWPCEIAEHNSVGDSVGHVEHGSDVDSLSKNPNYYKNNKFELTGGLEGADTLFKLLPNGDIVANKVFNYETDPHEYVIFISLTDSLEPHLFVTDTVKITLIDINEKPEILTDSVSVTENAKKGTVIDTIEAKDLDLYDTVLTFTLVEDRSGCFEVSKSGVVTVKVDNCKELDYEKNPELPIKVKVTDTKGGSDTNMVRVIVKDINEAPSIEDQTIHVSEDHKVNTVVDTVVATDPDRNPEYSHLVYTVLSGDTATFAVDSLTGEVILKDSLDYETKDSVYKLVVQVDDGQYRDTATVTIKVDNKVERSEVKITEVDDSKKVWTEPDTVFTNQPGREICWVQDGMDTCQALTITKDTVVIIRFQDPTKDFPGIDTVYIFYSNASPVVSISASTDDVTAGNVYTIVEQTDKADTNLYVNSRKNIVTVSVKDAASKTDTTFDVKLTLEPVKVSQKNLDVLNAVAEGGLILNENPKGGSDRVPMNGNQVKVSYREVVGKDTVTVSYMVDNNGNPVKVAVVNAKGEVDSVEVMTVSYEVLVDGQKVTISYQADAITGEVLVKDSNGTLMASGASKANSTKSDSKSVVTEGMFQITYSTKDPLGNSTTVSYSVDEKGNLVKNAEGDMGYAVTYTYTNVYGNAASRSVFIVLDQVGPKVEILKPTKGQVVRSNFVDVVWTVDGVKQDTLTLQGLEKGPNVIVRFYRDKAGNEASDTVLVVMKDSKDVEIAVVQPVTEIDPEKVREYYDDRPLEEGETFSVSIMNPTTGKEYGTIRGGSFGTKKGEAEELYPGKDVKHLGPTLAMDIKLPVVNAVGGLATLDDLVSSDGMIALEGVDAENSNKVTVESYVRDYCEDGLKLSSDLGQVNLYNSKMQVNIWVYTSIGSFVDYFSFTQDMNNPDFANDAGMLKMYFEMKPNEDGFVRADNGKFYATGSYVYKVEASIKSELRCTLPPVADPTGKKKGDLVKSSDELLKSFGYKRPNQ